MFNLIKNRKALVKIIKSFNVSDLATSIISKNEILVKYSKSFNVEIKKKKSLFRVVQFPAGKQFPKT